MQGCLRGLWAITPISHELCCVVHGCTQPHNHTQTVLEFPFILKFDFHVVIPWLGVHHTHLMHHVCLSIYMCTCLQQGDNGSQNDGRLALVAEALREATALGAALEGATSAKECLMQQVSELQDMVSELQAAHEETAAVRAAAATRGTPAVGDGLDGQQPVPEQATEGRGDRAAAGHGAGAGGEGAEGAAGAGGSSNDGEGSSEAELLRSELRARTWQLEEVCVEGVCCLCAACVCGVCVAYQGVC